MDAATGTAIATAAVAAGPETMTAAASAAMATSTSAFPVATAAPVGMPAFDLTNPTMIAIYVAVVVALIVKGLIDLLVKKIPAMGQKGADGEMKIRKGAVILVQTIAGAVVYLVTHYAFGWPIELAGIAAGGGYGAGVADLAYKAVTGRPPLVEPAKAE